MRKVGTCTHFNGIQNKMCRAEVTYPNGPLPCFKSGPVSATDPPECEKYREPTVEEIATDEADMESALSRMRIVMPVVKKWRTWSKTNRVAKQGAIDCPTGCGGTLHLSQAAYNGHVWGKCTTEGCMNWME